MRLFRRHFAVTVFAHILIAPSLSSDDSPKYLCKERRVFFMDTIILKAFEDNNGELRLVDSKWCISGSGTVCIPISRTTAVNVQHAI